LALFFLPISRFLLNVKRTQLKLQDTWGIQIKIKDRLNEELQLRTHMMFVVSNLQHYLMADVLESQVIFHTHTYMYKKVFDGKFVILVFSTYWETKVVVKF